MNDYEPVDLASVANAGAEVLSGDQPPELGAVTLRGLPFLLGPRPVACGPESGALTIPLGAAVTRVVVAHVLLEPVALGELVATYRFRAASGDVDVAIRAGFEIGAARPPWGRQAFACWSDRGDSQPPRYSGAWSALGFRQTEVQQGGCDHWCLWVWQPPAPGPVESLCILPAGPRFVVAGVTLSHVDEDPFPREAAVPVVIETTDGEPRPGALEVAIDRGTATYAMPLPAAPAEAWLADDLRGWGQEQNPQASPAVSLVSGVPSATVTVHWQDTPLGRVSWRQVRAEGAAADGVVRVRMAEEGRNWVHTRVVDADTGRPIPCRIHFRGRDGVPYQPHGHHAYANGNLGSWHEDLGGDLRLGQTTYAYIDGTCQGWLPRGEVYVDVAKGYEWEPLRTVVELAPGQRELTLALRRLTDLNAAGWYSGDSHVHFLSTVGAHLEAAGEGVNVVNLLQSQWGHLFTSTEEFTGRPDVRDGTIVFAAQENRQHVLGHLTLLGLREPVMPWCSDGPSEAELGGNVETTLARWADACHAQGGTVVLPHAPNPNGEPAALIATGRADAWEFLVHDEAAHREYYRYLNAGYRLPLVGGTDKMTQDVPVGLYRTYVHLPPGEEFTYENWCRGLRAGRTVLSGGPLLTFSVEGRLPGEELRLSAAGTVNACAQVCSIFPVGVLQIIRNGEVVAERTGDGAKALALSAEIPVDEHSWLAARVAGPGYGRVPHHDGWRRGIMAHSSPVYVALAGAWQRFDAGTAQYMLTLIAGSLTHLRAHTRHFPDDAVRVTHHHGRPNHAKWLEEPFHEARAAIHRRLHEMGVAH